MQTSVMFFEVLGQDPARLQGFFSELFGWRFEPTPGMKYATTVPTGTGIAGGVGEAMTGTGWSTFYVEVESVAETIARAEALGGPVLVPPFTLPDGMIVAVLADPEGHPIGISSKG
jgi:uncharacterized protein